ncbi:MBL fold metallo-hydrolase [Caballeronia ptereochthonis]|uniref:Beta-lactamase domain-containing protein n=1 Tax=Caballeronia ptereochthonis TaxID=1777144 RepID=A0A158BH39_9BURK|nr:MBL fold metallo-hydrolase [Caballeronia ptereochthonis]SAK69086.1 beta-lactamase domain-containing protein [Caballeronia ptereochthonis]
MYQVDVLIQGYPGKAVCHGGLGWSTIALLRGRNRTILIDVGAFGVRRELLKQLRQHGVEPEAITDVVLTHAHYDHSVNFTLFPTATIWIGEDELAWAERQPPGFNPLPELYVRELAASSRVRRVAANEMFIEGIRAIPARGHTPGSLLFHLEANEPPVLFTGDAAKNRAELLSHDVDATADRAESQDTIDRIWRLWRATPGAILIPGHDLSMRLDDNGNPAYTGRRSAAIAAWFGESIELTAKIDLEKSSEAA